MQIIKTISYIMWGLLLGFFLLSFILSIIGERGLGMLIAQNVGFLAPIVALIQVILWTIEKVIKYFEKKT